MTQNKDTGELSLTNSPISLYDELVAYEALWGIHSETLKTISEKFSNRGILPSELLSEIAGLLGTTELTQPVAKYLESKQGFSVLLRGCYQYPERLLDARHPVNLLYYRGDIGLLDSPAVAVVGARDCSTEGQHAAHRIAASLVRNEYSVVSGLAKGIDTAALNSAIKGGGHVIGVIGTPIDEYYPKENRSLQDTIAYEHLLISHVPMYRYHNEPFKARRFHFPSRNALMSAISIATVIVEASDRSGTLTQARACLQQGRKLFITDNCFRNQGISWPEKYLKRGAIRVSTPQDIIDILGNHNETTLDQD